MAPHDPKTAPNALAVTQMNARNNRFLRHLEEAKRAEARVRPEEMARLERRIAWEESFRIEPRFTLFEDSSKRLNRTQALGFTVGSLAPVELRASFGTMTFEEETFAPFEALEGEMGLALRASSHLRFDARVRQREASTFGPASTNYAREELRFGRGLLSYSKGFPSGWNVDASVELGWARDALRGDRFTAYARGQAVQAWSSRFRSSLGWSFASSPGYQSWSLTLGLHYGFIDIGQSSF